jgi:cyclohexadienyl dehydratase
MAMLSTRRPDTRRTTAAACGRALLTGVVLAILAARAGAAPLRVGSSGDYAPFSELASDGTWHGFDLEIARRLARDLGMRLELVRFRWPQLLADMERGAFDVAMSGVTMNATRAVVGRYTRPYAVVGTVVLIRTEEARRFDSLITLDQPGVRVAVNAGGHLERLARRLFRRAAIMPTADNQMLPEHVLSGRADAALTDAAEAAVWQRPELRVVGPFTHEHKAFLLPAGRAELARTIDRWLVARTADGWLDERRRLWLGAAGGMNAERSGREAVGALVRLRLELMPAVAAAKAAAGLPLADPAQEERVIGRVRRRAAGQPDRLERIYRVLIELAKTVQQQRLPVDDPAALPALRDAIERIDEQLVREIERAPTGDLPRWVWTLARELADLPVDKSLTVRFAALLAGPGDKWTAQTPALLPTPSATARPPGR